MEISQIDRSTYLKGLLIIAKKNNHLTESKKNIIKNISGSLGFSTDFYEETICNLLSNNYIEESPVKFSSTRIAKSFIEDGLRLAYSGSKTSSEEINWLNATALINGIDAEWLSVKLIEIKNKPHVLANMEFALYSLI